MTRILTGVVGGDTGQDRQLSVTVPHRGHRSRKRVDERMGRKCLSQRNPQAALLTQARRPAGPSDSEVMPGSQVPTEVP